ncbi:V/A-type H+-transporting ATPase subunit I [Caldanaerobius fijiensis DSM 17918]|uniref:V/A-type H+-transporting ATPase subunit I n=1 Tax=Caldanaerobius fijiensis DSM 17918 TaxID=1121256 RepID=A0A1M4W9U4_9THEO|nr:V-type ATPase 116kDa subunit family protein [Caldanaerobius fijiensis]SHE77945.1 V/A-type H+-transporting ATPase subunit I [Caldanaerobius fijiensis DSM 17918]
MAVERMKVIGIIGPISDLNKCLREVILNGSVHIINAFNYINTTNFALSPSEDHVEALEEIPYLKPYSSKVDFSEDERMIKTLLDVFEIDDSIKQEYVKGDYDYGEYIKEIKALYAKVEKDIEEIKKQMEYIRNATNYISNLQLLKDFNVDIDSLVNMKHFSFKLMSFSIENFQKLRKNYENIPAIVKRIATSQGNVIAYAVVPKILEETAERIFSSLNYTELNLPGGYKGNATTIVNALKKEIEDYNNEIERLRGSLAAIKSQYIESLKQAKARLTMEKNIEALKEDIAFGKKLFFMFGFVPVSKVNGLNKLLNDLFGPSIITVVEDVKGTNPVIVPPTRLINLKIFKPFEYLVKMYGVPSYNEVDPTAFFAITYLLLFGAMFGDIGQGFVILLAGLLLTAKLKGSDFGGILIELGASSMFFGILYGSVFGLEHVLDAVLVRPMLNINTMLMAAVVIGIILMSVSFIISLINNKRKGDLEEGVFGRNGIAGLIFYWVLLLTILCVINGVQKYVGYLIVVMLLLLALMVFKQPIANGLRRRGILYEGPVADYYIEEGFGVIETLLSMVSNTISFIRVGAFALNHVGLFLAFATMANMISSKIAGLGLLVLGNVVIIALEGLIVFIQALRLEYYELFSKYYSGDGIEYNPVHL